MERRKDTEEKEREEEEKLVSDSENRGRAEKDRTTEVQLNREPPLIKVIVDDGVEEERKKRMRKEQNFDKYTIQ